LDNRSGISTVHPDDVFRQLNDGALGNFDLSIFVEFQMLNFVTATAGVAVKSREMAEIGEIGELVIN
jgi:hypothetical protein